MKSIFNQNFFYSIISLILDYFRFIELLNLILILPKKYSTSGIILQIFISEKIYAESISNFSLHKSHTISELKNPESHQKDSGHRKK